MTSQREKRMTPAKARRLIAAIDACLECGDLEGSDRVALEDARAVIDQFDREQCAA